jgi:hypothetical protein
MTPERAQHILRTRDAWGGIRYGFAGPGGEMVHADGMTREERDYVSQVWRGMPGYTAFIDALARVARGEVPAAATTYTVTITATVAVEAASEDEASRRAVEMMRDGEFTVESIEASAT